MQEPRQREPPEGAFDARRTPPWTGFLPNEVTERILGMDSGPHFDGLKRVLLSVEEDDLVASTGLREKFAAAFHELQLARFDHEKSVHNLPEDLWQDLKEWAPWREVYMVRVQRRRGRGPPRRRPPPRWGRARGGGRVGWSRWRRRPSTRG